MELFRFLASLHRLGSTPISSSKNDELLDQEQNRLYLQLLKNHANKNGPWTVMTSAAVKEQPRAILDIACGMGEPALTIAKALPQCRIVATDVSRDMVSIARNNAATIKNMTVELADMADLKAFGDSSFDVITCCYGFMFPRDKNKALQEVMRVLKPGGTLIATVWLNLELTKIPQAIMMEVMDKAPPAALSNSMSLSEPGLFERMVRQAGFVDLQVSEHSYSFNLGNDADDVYAQALLTVSDIFDDHGVQGKARKLFEQGKLEFGAYNDDGNYFEVRNNVYQMVICKTSHE